MRNGVTENELIEKAKITGGERVTLADIEASIVRENYFNGYDAACPNAHGEGVRPPDGLALLTICTLVLANGFTILGKSACADPANFNEELGRRLARTDAVNQIWPLMGFELKSRLARDQQLIAGSMVEPGEGFATYIGTKVINAHPMTRGAYNELRGWKIPDNEEWDDDGYLVEYTDRVENPPHVKGFQGYVSWSPKEVFERAYRPVRQGASATASAEGSGQASVEGKGKQKTLAEISYLAAPGEPDAFVSMKVTYNGVKLGCYREFPNPASDKMISYETLAIIKDMVRVMEAHGEKKEETWLDRLKAEHAELWARYDKLHAFILDHAFTRLPAVDREDLRAQLYVMEGYKRVLERRLARQELKQEG